ncbi:hypothetical protein I317_07136 [Kwoniella heveanensis CBS 569]|nr:hypothetical protein I317_07136 [Kwoniella heveanensis CBS 569]
MSTYKPLSVPLPPQVQAGESWRLGLFTGSVLGEEESGRTDDDDRGEGCSCLNLLSLVEDDPPVLGVWSEGIQIVRPDIKSSGITKSVNGGKSDLNGNGSSKGQRHDGPKGKGKDKGKGKEKEKDDGPKQGRITREFELPSSSTIDGMLRIVEQTSFDLDKKIWDSGLALSAWLWKYLPSASNTAMPHAQVERVIDLLRTNRDNGAPLRILELGGGTGLVSIALALALRGYFPHSSRYITATDLGSAIPLMDENLSTNRLASPRPASQEARLSSSSDNAPAADTIRLDAKVLDWNEDIPSWVDEQWPEVIIAADVTYNTSAFPSLLSNLTSLLNPPLDRQRQPQRPQTGLNDHRNGNGTRPLLLLAYKQRDAAERDLWGMLREKGVGMVLVDKVKGAEEEGETEIWVGGMDVSL